jgi:hypothetical protein
MGDQSTKITDNLQKSHNEQSRVAPMNLLDEIDENSFMGNYLSRIGG